MIFKGIIPIVFQLIFRWAELWAVFLKMLDNSIKSFIMLDHLLVMTPALFMGSSSNGLAHHSVDVPFSSIFLASLYHFFEFDQESNVFLIFFIIPMRCGECFFVVLSLFKTVDNLFRSKDPRFNFIDGNLVTVIVQWFSRRKLGEGNHVIHVIENVKNIIKVDLNIIKIP